MLTKLEVSGFKNLIDVSVAFGPFTCVAGENAVGKSNLFDAIEFLALLADRPLMEAAQRVRGSDGAFGDLRDLFARSATHISDTMRFAAEMIVPRQVRDDFGRHAEATSTFLRYELELGYEAPSGLATLGRLVLNREHLSYIKMGDARQHMRFDHAAGRFRNRVVMSNRRGASFISTAIKNGEPIIEIHQDGGSRGHPRPSPARDAPSTALGTTRTSSDPTILAARREMMSWRRLALEPSALRCPDPFEAPAELGVDGSHLPASLHRLAHPSDIDPADAEAHAARVYAEVANTLSRLIQVDEIRVRRDDSVRRLTLELKHPGGPFLPARALSDGTLRFLALAVLGEDPTVTGLVCMEEPENGIHPGRMGSMVELVRDLAVDPQHAPGLDNPLRQVVVNTHSPTFVELQQREDLLLATRQSHRMGGSVAHGLSLRPLADTWRCTEEDRGVGVGQIIAYLEAPPGGQLRLPSPLRTAS